MFVSHPRARIVYKPFVLRANTKRTARGLRSYLLNVTKSKIRIAIRGLKLTSSWCFWKQTRENICVGPERWPLMWSWKELWHKWYFCIHSHVLFDLFMFVLSLALCLIQIVLLGYILYVYVWQAHIQSLLVSHSKAHTHTHTPMALLLLQSSVNDVGDWLFCDTFSHCDYSR